jgi:CRP-like cAMP-binding protein
MQGVLHQLPLLCGLTDSQREAVIAAGHERTVAKGETVFFAGEAADAMYGVLEGRVKLVRPSSRGRELLLHLVQAGETFAEAAFFGAGPIRPLPRRPRTAGCGAGRGIGCCGW